MFKNVQMWLPAYIKQGLIRRRPRYPLHVLFAFVDHFEPEQEPGDPVDLQVDRLDEWIKRYEERYRDHADGRGRPPQHTYFFPQEQYNPALLDKLSAHCGRGFGEVEIHIHHDNDTPQGFRDKINNFKDQLVTHGLLSRDRIDGRVRYGFIHGNWALDNSRRDGRWCGLNDEITLLRETGCYADFTLPCAPADGQTGKINSVYFADDDPQRPKSHDRGRDVVFGGRGSGDLLLIQGPLTLNWKNRTRGILPRIENADIGAKTPLTRERMLLWLNTCICVRGKEDVLLVKVHTHGMKPRHFDFLLGEGMEKGFSLLEGEFNDGERCRLYYVTAREMANLVMAYNDGIDGPVPELIDYRYLLL
ncbi:MAG: hypothetical protein JXB45_02420 [Candidatus Krumholzibacteriota bacterium]|nr:hypothetical protein [Candidatus Krumholzibacteriota bacterium]